MDDIAFSDWPGQPVDLSGSNPWLPAYGYQQPAALLDKDDFIGNPDAALFLQGNGASHYVFLETILEETSDDLRSESDRSGSRASPVGWLATDSESGSVIHVDLEGLDEIDSGSESEMACPAKRRRQDPNLLSIPSSCTSYSDTDSNHSLSRSSSLLQFETLEKHCQDVYSSSPSILSLFSQDSLEQQRKTNDLSPDSLDRCHSDTESDSDYYKMLKIDSTLPTTIQKSKRYRDSLFYNTKRLSSGDSDSNSDSQDSDETLQVASRSNSCRSVQNLKSCRSFDSLHVIKQKKEKMSAENLSEDSGYSDHLCNYMKNKSSSIPNMQVQGITLPEKSTNKPINELKKVNGRSSTEDLNMYRLKNIKMCEGGFAAYDAEPGYQSFASHFGSSYQDLTVFEKYEPLAGFRTALIDRFMFMNGAKKRGNYSLKPAEWCRRLNHENITSSTTVGAGAAAPQLQHQLQHQLQLQQADVLNIGAPVECVATSKFSGVLASASEPNLLQQTTTQASCDAGSALSDTYFYINTTSTTENNCKHSYFEGSVCVSSVPKDLNLAGDISTVWSHQFTSTTHSSIAEKNWDLADLPPPNSNTSPTSSEEDESVNSVADITENLNKMAAHVYRQEGSNVSAMLRQQRESSSVSGGSDISVPVPRYRREGSYVKAISEYLDITDITDDEREQSYQDPTETTSKILDIEARIEKAISETSIQSFTDDTTKIRMLFHSTPINKRNVTSTPNLSAINSEKLFVDTSFDNNSEIRRSMQIVPRKSSLIDRTDRSASSSGMSDPEDKTITSKTFSGSGSTTKGVHFCPIVSEVSWRDSSSSSEDISSYSVSSTPHETTPELETVTPPVKPPRYDMKTPPRKSSSQPEITKTLEQEKETEYIFIPLNPAKWASSTPSMSQSSNETPAKQQQQQQQEKRPPTSYTTSSGSHVVSRQQQQLALRQHQQKPAVVVVPSSVPVPVPVSAMEPTVLQRPVSAPTPVQVPVPPKQTRTNKLGGFLSRFASFRFSNRKSNEEKAKKKSASLNTKQTSTNVNVTQPTTSEKDYIYIPLKGPLPPALRAREINNTNGNQKVNNNNNARITNPTVVNNNYVETEPCISAKPPLPKMPPRVVSACVKPAPTAPPRRPTTNNIDSGVVAAVSSSLSRNNRNACSMEPMGLIETDLDTEVTIITAGGSGAGGAHVKTRSLMNLGGAEPPLHHHGGGGKHRGVLLTAVDVPGDRPHKSMEFLLDKQNLKAVEPPENELQKGTSERVMSEHQLRVQRSLQKLTVPEWYKANQVPREGFILKKQRGTEPRWTGTGGSSTTNNSKTPSLSSLGSGHSPILLSPQPHGQQQQPFTRWSTSKLNSAASSPCASTRSSFNHRTSNGGISPCSVRSSFSYRQPYLGWRSQERLTRPRTPAERLATSLLPAVGTTNHVADHQRIENPEIQTSIKEVTSAIVHYCGLKPEQGDRNSLSPTSSPRFERNQINSSPRLRTFDDNASQRSTSPQSRGSQKLCWLESSFVGTRPLDSPQTPVTLNPQAQAEQGDADAESPLLPPTTLRLDLQKNINTEMMAHMLDLNTTRPSPSSTTLEDVLDSLLGLPPSTRAPSPSLQETASANTSPSKLNRGGDNYRRRSEGSEPSGRQAVTTTSTEHPRRVSFHASPSTDTSAASATVKCRYSRCGKVSGKTTDTGKKYKNCHNCTYIYCSRECRRAHWEKHRMTCLFSRVGALCRQVLAAAKENKDVLKNISLLARQGFLAQGNGAVKCFFSSPECAEKFISGNIKALGEPVYVPWADLLPSEMGPNLYSDLIKMCKAYNPDTKLVLYVSVCVVSEVPATGAVKWERQLVSRCAKIRLCKSVVEQINPDKKLLDKKAIIVTPPIVLQNNEDMSVQKCREVSFTHIQRQLRQRGVSLKRQFPEVYQKLCAYVEGKSDKFAPVTVYPKDATTGKSFMIIIMPDVTEPDKFKLKFPTDSPKSSRTSVTEH